MLITPRQALQLAGKSFGVQDVDGLQVEFSFPETPGWPRDGLEAYAVPVICHHPTRGDIPSILKIFKYNVAVRPRRLSHLIGYGLAAKHDYLYSGVPYLWVNKELDGITLQGHAAQHVCADFNGDDFKRIKDQDVVDEFTRDSRARFAAQLCWAVHGLEALKITHGDLSPPNIVLGYDNMKQNVRCVLIDYDGFRVPNEPMLPRKHNGQPTRPLGTPGYQHPMFQNRIMADVSNQDDTIYVPNDRFALGVLCCELMVWSSAAEKQYHRSELLSTEEITAGRPSIPEVLQKEWPEGANLLEIALDGDPADQPEPEAWLRALGHLEETGFKGHAHLVVSKIVGNNPKRVKGEFQFGKRAAGTGDFSDIGLKEVSYWYRRESTGVQVKLIVSWPHPVVGTRNGRRLKIERATAPQPRPLEISVAPTDQIRSNGWEFAFNDGAA